MKTATKKDADEKASRESFSRRVYVDNNATTSVAPEVLEAMLPYLGDFYGNPSSAHWFGRSVRSRVEEAREHLAALIGADDPSEIVFCASGSESDNMAVKGSATNHPQDGSWQVVNSAIEHPAVFNTVKYLGKNGYRRKIIGVDKYAIVNPDGVKAALDDKTAVVSIMHGNNEVGVLQDIKKIAAAVKNKGILMHTDAVQSAGKVPIDVNDLGVDLLSFSAHKLHGPKGVGALYIRKGAKIHPLITGGHHERGRRAGTENVPGIVGFGKACEIAKKRMADDSSHIAALRDELQKRILGEIPYVRLNGHPEKRLPTTLNVSIESVEGETMMIQCDMNGIALSTGSACSSGSLDPSHVLIAMDIPHEIIHGSLRFSFGHDNTMEDVDYIMRKLPKIVETTRAISPLWGTNGPIPIEDL
ncbi:MAG: cysteine desulfurase NifS [bacterium]|nr:MAG: cysteine desulfurase NifS [bacterium]